ncbi:MAG: T9SS type A sorting domain-containing protein [candidate division Zixibacteria bacterium]|nr:T9SS type A sorting domain-containing protein [candidate division Zixibacteria bacterium]
MSDSLALYYSTIDVPIHNAGIITVQGVCNLNGTLTTQTSSILRLAYAGANGSDLILTNGFTNNGLIDLVNTYYSRSVIIRSTNGPLVNSSSGTIDANSPAGYQNILAELDNQGTMNIGWPLTLDSASANHTNSGTINITGGNFSISQSELTLNFRKIGNVELDNGYTLDVNRETAIKRMAGDETDSVTTPSFSNTGTLIIDDGFVLDINGGNFVNQVNGILAGNGTIDLTGGVTNFTNAGIVSPGMSPGALSITGMDLVQESTSIINIEISNTTSGDFDSLYVSNDVTKGGLLSVGLYDGYFPAISDSVLFLSANSVSGSFDSLDLQIGGIVFDTVSTSNAVSLVCIQADNYDPTISLDSTLSFSANDSVHVDLLAATDDIESPDSLLGFGFTTDNDSLIVAFDSSTGIMTLKSYVEYEGTVELIVTVTDPQAGSAEDTIMVDIGEAATCLVCNAITQTPTVPNVGGVIMWDLEVTNCEVNTPAVYGEIYPTVGDCASGTQYDYDVNRMITSALNPGETYTGYYYYYPGTVTGIDQASVNISVGPAVDDWVANCCFEFFFTYEWGKQGNIPQWGAGVWSERNEEIDSPPVIPIVTSLNNCYPNPFNSTVTVPFELAEKTQVSLSVYNLMGQIVAVLVDKNMEAGQHNLTWDASEYSSGVYFYKLNTDDKTFTKRMTLLK